MQIRQIRGVYHALHKRYDAAIADFSMVVEQEPDNGNAHYNLGLAYFETGNYELIQDRGEKSPRARLSADGPLGKVEGQREMGRVTRRR